MKVKFINNTSYQTFPITDDMIEVDELTLSQIGKTKQFFNNEIVDYKSTLEYEQEIDDLKLWFDTFYTEHEQKYRRLIALNKLTDDNKSPNQELMYLYNVAEEKRLRLQQLENAIKNI